MPAERFPTVAGWTTKARAATGSSSQAKRPHDSVSDRHRVVHRLPTALTQPRRVWRGSLRLPGSEEPAGSSRCVPGHPERTLPRFREGHPVGPATASGHSSCSSWTQVPRTRSWTRLGVRSTKRWLQQRTRLSATSTALWAESGEARSVAASDAATRWRGATPGSADGIPVRTMPARNIHGRRPRTGASNGREDRPSRPVRRERHHDYRTEP